MPHAQRTCGCQYEVLLANYQKSMEEVAGLRSAIAAALEELAAAPEINARQLFLRRCRQS